MGQCCRQGGSGEDPQHQVALRQRAGHAIRSNPLPQLQSATGCTAQRSAPSVACRPASVASADRRFIISRAAISVSRPKYVRKRQLPASILEGYTRKLNCRQTHTVDGRSVRVLTSDL